MKYSSFMAAIIYAAISGTSAVQADDIEVYITPPPNPVGPNILFILDESGSMEWGSGTTDLDDSNPNQRMNQLKRAMNTLLNDSAMDNVNAAILGYHDSDITLTAHSTFRRVSEGANRASLLTAVNGLVHSGSTPSSPAILEGLNWFRGNSSPIGNWCEPNYMIFLTDGEPNANYSNINNGYRYEGTKCSDNEADYDWSGTNGSDSGARCSATYAQWGYDHRPKTAEAWNYGDNDSSLENFRNLITHTIGFHTSAGSVKENYLKEIAHKSRDENPTHTSANFDNNYDTGNSDDLYTGGRYVRASNAAQLLTALQSFVKTANTGLEITYTAPVIPYNPNNSAVSGNVLYIPIIRPQAKTHWRGNLKKYKITTNADDNVVILDADNQVAVNSSNQFCDGTNGCAIARSLWSDSADGNNPIAGGAASQQSGVRNLYTHLASGGTGNADLTADVNRVRDANTDITGVMLGGVSETDRTDILNWISWMDPEAEHRGKMGAPIHGQPVVVPYSGSNDVVYLPTSEGVIHAIDAESGAELWAFMPDELLTNIKTLKSNPDTAIAPIYGLDGPMMTYTSGGRVFLVVGMRRGGRNYYALDISARTSPRFAWEIKGGSGGYSKLGQTWSKPEFTKINTAGGSTVDALIFGGGYHPAQDLATSRSTDAYGNAIYIVNATSGAPLHELTTAGMNNGIAADVLIVDMDNNGVTDRVYAAGVGGRIIRVDLNDELSDATLNPTLGVIADMNSGGSGFQKFFNTPEVAYLSRGGNRSLAITIGSGHLPKPLSTTVTDRFYMIQDPNVFYRPTSYNTVAESDLADISGGETTTEHGWYLDLSGSGEKVLSNAVVHNSIVFFTTYKGSRSDNTDVCAVGNTIGESRFYAIALTTADAIPEFANTMDSLDERSKLLDIPGLPPAPTLLFPSDENAAPTGKVLLLVGLEEALQWDDRLLPIYWEELIND